MFCSGFGPSGLGGSWMFFAMGIRLLAFVGLVFLSFKLFKKYTDNSNHTMKILDEKFASGEISEEEYLKRKSILSQKD
ncbi:hypothetical protein DUF2078 [Gottschalkia acidurici 9a]|uniref:SHOCT domain-containing protein n=1 Tax=Gottschalkia acidurici (strain ATCC 7906 / DSM 604 / BCRC 14475 / CIP 104303 / KCTC 5404 / NCIMB 10678 / 9a) TaxID=1128398 RepID=K0B0K3_GOTA9|nr:SHOCT domain-containing protein [Gottschalkia acidurici]AFS79064.1 hypothetical protein DUF2078 [Gottschalkia acidurici 9a]